MDLEGKAEIPIIDIGSAKVGARQREKLVKQVKEALEKWGLFQAVNHGISSSFMDRVLLETLKFHEEGSKESKQAAWPDNSTSKVRYRSIFQRHLTHPSWKNTLSIHFTPDAPTLDEFSSPYRETILEYAKQAKWVGESLLGLVSEAMGLEEDRLKRMGCLEGMRVASHLYPPSPHHDLTVGILPHSDPSFLTLLLQDLVGGLQVLQHHHTWVPVTPVHGALVVSVGDLLQLVSNGKLTSLVHRVAVSQNKGRTSVACLINGSASKERLAPINELLMDDDHDSCPLYRETTAGEYLAHFASLEDFTTGLAHLRI